MGVAPGFHIPPSSGLCGAQRKPFSPVWPAIRGRSAFRHARGGPTKRARAIRAPGDGSCPVLPAVASRAGPPEGHDSFVLRTLSDMAKTNIPKHKRYIVFGVHLKDVSHPVPAQWTGRVLDTLHPRRPTGQLVPRFAVRDFLCRTSTYPVRHVEVELVAFEPKSASVKIVCVFQPEFIVLTAWAGRRSGSSPRSASMAGGCAESTGAPARTGEWDARCECG